LKLFQEEKERHIVICVDMNTAMRFGTKNTFKSVQAARVAAILGWKGLAEQDRISACLFGDVVGGIQFFAPKRTRKSFCSLLKTMSEPPVERHRVSLTESIQQLSRSVHAGSLVYLISDFMDIDQQFPQESNISWLSQKCDVVFVAINDRADKSMYPMGTIGFRGIDAEKIHVNTESLVGRKSYAALWDEHERLLQEIGMSLKIPILELTTESHLQKDLVLGLKNIARRKK
jgi:uncharacterized protein (DUF58 family)